MTNFQDLTDSALKSTAKEIDVELRRRAELRDLEALRLRNEHHKLVLANIDVLLLFTEHDLTTCSDESPDNPGLCTRCGLLDIKRLNYMDAEDHIEIRVLCSSPCGGL